MGNQVIGNNYSCEFMKDAFGLVRRDGDSAIQIVEFLFQVEEDLIYHNKFQQGKKREGKSLII